MCVLCPLVHVISETSQLRAFRHFPRYPAKDNAYIVSAYALRSHLEFTVAEHVDFLLLRF